MVAPVAGPRGAGIALLHIERAATGLAPWQPARDWLTYATTRPVTTGPDSHLFYGAPALAHAFACAAAHRPGSYGRVLDALDRAITDDARRRLDRAHVRIDHGALPVLAEFDVIRGLAGIGAYLLRRDPQGKELRGVLEYLVRLTEPVTADGEQLPGWWTESDPSGRASGRFPGGHANSGMAHGIAGPLTLLALAARRGITVDGHHEGMDRIVAWLDRWSAPAGTGEVWPYWVSREQLRAGHRHTSEAQPPSWCYGTAGLARAQQLAALAVGDTDRRDRAEQALLHALSSPTQRAATTTAALCHGHTGLAHVAAVTAADATPGVAQQLRALIPGLLDAVVPAGTDPSAAAGQLVHAVDTGAGFLDGAAGIALALSPAATGAVAATGWDTCLLIT